MVCTEAYLPGLNFNPIVESPSICFKKDMFKYKILFIDLEARSI